MDAVVQLYVAATSGKRVSPIESQRTFFFWPLWEGEKGVLTSVSSTIASIRSKPSFLSLSAYSSRPMVLSHMVTSSSPPIPVELEDIWEWMGDTCSLIVKE